jgi:hypothetical protein
MTKREEKTRATFVREATIGKVLAKIDESLSVAAPLESTHLPVMAWFARLTIHGLHKTPKLRFVKFLIIVLLIVH